MKLIDLNADLGEGFGSWSAGDDAEMLKLVSTANIACGFHAGDPNIMRSTVRKAKELGVAYGAHPGYMDLIGFGRRRISGISLAEMENLIAYQVGALAGIGALEDYPMSHVKTHGALGNVAADDDEVALAVARAIKAVDPKLTFMVMPGTATARAAEKLDLKAVNEVYADRTYDDQFNLSPRSEAGSVIHDAHVLTDRVLEILATGEITSTSGKKLEVDVRSICVHGDTAGAVDMTRHLRGALEANGWTIASAVEK